MRIKYRTAQNKVRAILDLHDRARKNYEAADEVFRTLRRDYPPGVLIKTRRGTYAIVDNFAQKNSAYKPARFTRFELKLLSRKPRS